MLTLVSGPAFSSGSDNNNIEKPKQAESTSEGGVCLPELPKELIGMIYRFHRVESHRAVNKYSRNLFDQLETERINNLSPNDLIRELWTELRRNQLNTVRVNAIISRFNNDDDSDINTRQLNQVNDRGLTALTEAARHGHTEAVRALLAREDININHANRYARTALMLAARYGHTDVVALLKNHNKRKVGWCDYITKIYKYWKDDDNDDDSPGKPGDKAVTKTSSGSKGKPGCGVSTNTSTKKARGNPKKDDTRSKRLTNDRDFHSSYRHFTNKLAPYFSTAALGVMIGLPRGQIGK